MRIHFIGICGYAVSGLAQIAKQLGNDVTGSDEDAYPPTTEILTRAGIPWVDGHTAGNVTRWGKPDLVVQGNQVREGNPETETARRLDIRLISEAEYWGELTADRFRIVVAGSAGKTTTASLVAWILRAAGRNPGFRLGMAVKDLGSAAAWGSGRDFVFEGDEYTSAVFDPRPKFLHFAPQLAVLTNIDWDHPDVFPDPAAYEAVFRELLEDLGPEDRLIACSDDATVRRLLARGRRGRRRLGSGRGVGRRRVGHARVGGLRPRDARQRDEQKHDDCKETDHGDSSSRARAASSRASRSSALFKDSSAVMQPPVGFDPECRSPVSPRPRMHTASRTRPPR